MTDSIRLWFYYAKKGFKDSVYGTFKIYQMDKDHQQMIKETPSSPQKQEHMSTLARRRAERMKHKEVKSSDEPRVLHRIFMCCAWNGGIFWTSILLFNLMLKPGLKYLIELIFWGSSSAHTVWDWVSPLVSWTFGTLWILPLFVLSKIVNCLWFQDIADAAYRRSRGRPNYLPSLSKMIADILFSLTVQGLFLIQGMLAGFLPIHAVGELVGLTHMCLLYSLYAFEYKWFNMGWEIHKRVSYIENNWPYFVGFGLPLAVLTWLPSSYIVSGCVFSILFPLFIISGNEAEPIPGTYDFPVRLFSPVVRISDSIFRISIRKSHVSSAPSSAKSTPTKQVKIPERR